MTIVNNEKNSITNNGYINPSLSSVTLNTEARSLPETAHLPEAGLEEVKGEESTPFPFKTDPSSFPDGGFQASLVVLGTFCCFFCSFGWIGCIGVFQAYYQNHQLRHYPPGRIAWIPSLEIFMMFLGGPIFGKLYDNYGPRWILFFGTFMHVFGLMMTSISTQYHQFVLAQGLCSAIGASAVFYSALNVIPSWFLRKRALAFSIAISGSSFGGIILSIMIERLANQIGFAWTMRTTASLILGLLIIANLTVKSRLPPSPKPLVIKEYFTPLLQEPPFLLTCIASYLFFWGLFLPLNFIIAQASASGMSTHLVGYLPAIVNATSLFGRILPGYVADHVGRFNIMILTSYLSAILVLANWLPAHTNSVIITFGALFGFASGSFMSMVPALIAQISDVHTIGVRNGTLFAIVSAAVLFGNPVGGALITHHAGNFWGLQIFSGIMMAAGSTLFVAARVKLAGWAWRTKV